MLKSGYNLSSLKEVNNLFLEILGDGADFNMVEVNDIPVLASGKRKPVINEWRSK